MHSIEELRKEIASFHPYNEQERVDKAELLQLLDTQSDLLTRDNHMAHFTVSAWIVSPDRKQVLMAYHNLYQSWAWLGGHADGNVNLKEVVLKEVEEESGLSQVRFVKEHIYSLEILPVSGHVKRGNYVASHLHLNVTYLLEADIEEPIRIKADENSQIGWIPVEEIGEKSTETWFVENIYKKLCEKWDM